MAGGIRIEPYKPLDVRTPVVLGGGYIDVDASAGNFDSPLTQLGPQGADGGAEIAAIVSGLIARDDEAAVKTADMRMGEVEQKLLFDPTNGYLNAMGETAVNHAPAVLEAYGQVQQREIEGLANGEQQRMLEALSQRRRATFSEQVERHSAAERLRWHDATSERRVAQMRADAGFHWSDDALLRRALGTTRAEVRDTAERHHWNSALTEMTLRQQTSRTLVAAIGAAVERDPERAQALRTRYDVHIEAQDGAALDALLSEATIRQRAQVASTEILNATPPEGEHSAAQWRLRQAEAVTDPAVRAITIRRVQSAAAADEARTRVLAEQVLDRVLKDGLTDAARIPVRDWMALDAERRQAIETRLDHNARGTEPAANPELVDELATQMTQAPGVFERRDLVPAIAHLPLPQWQRFRDCQAGIKRNDPTTEDQIYAIKRCLQLANRMLPDNAPDDDAVKLRAALIDEIDTTRKLAGKSPDDAALREMVRRNLPGESIHNIVSPLDPQQARRLAEFPGQALDALSGLFFMMLMQGIVLQSKVDRMTRAAPQAPPVSILPVEEPDDESPEPPADAAEDPPPRPSSSTPPPSTPPILPPPTGQQPQPGQPATSAPTSRPSRTTPEPWGRDYGKNWSPVASGKPQVDKGKQATHDPGHRYFKQKPGRSEFTHPDPQGLINRSAGTGQPANNVARGQPRFRERVDFGETIGKHNGVPTQRGIIHYAQDGTVHIVPSAP